MAASAPSRNHKTLTDMNEAKESAASPAIPSTVWLASYLSAYRKGFEDAEEAIDVGHPWTTDQHVAAERERIIKEVVRDEDEDIDAERRALRLANSEVSRGA